MIGQAHGGYRAARGGSRSPAHTRRPIAPSHLVPAILISNRQIPQLETHLTLATSTSTAFLIAKISQISNSHFTPRNFSSGLNGIARSLGNESLEAPISNRRSCQLEFRVTPCKQTMGSVSNQRKSAINSFAQNSFLIPFGASRAGKPRSKIFVSNGEIRRLETALTPAKPTRAPVLTAKKSHFARACFSRQELRFLRESGTLVFFRISVLKRHGASLAAVCFPGLISGGHQRDRDYDRDDVVNALVYIRHGAAQRVAEQSHAPHPGDPADDVVCEVARVLHSRRARHRRAERANDGYESREDDRLSAIGFVELLRALQVALLKEAGILALEESRPSLPADEVANLVSSYRAQRDQRQQPRQFQLAGSGEHARSHQQRIPGQEEPHEHPGFDEDDYADHQRAAPLDQAADIVKPRQKVLQEFEHRANTLAISAIWPADGSRPGTLSTRLAEKRVF